MKCGTTSLFNYLAAHPAVAACRTKEPDHFSSDDFDPDDKESYFALWDWDPDRHQIALEASVNYTKMPTMPNCAERIARFGARDFRFIYCMRDPIERIESHIYHGIYAGWNRSLESGIPQHTINVSRYAMQLDAYAACFDRERILLLVLEELQRSPETQLRRICEFLEIDPDFEFGSRELHNRSSDHYLPNEIWDGVRRREAFRRLASAIPAGLRDRIRRATGRRVDARRCLEEAERTQLLGELRSDLRRLQAVYGVDVTASWGIQP